MKKELLLLLALFYCVGLYAQKGSAFGIKAGVNYGKTGNLVETGQNIIDRPEAEIGYHAGFFGKIDLESVYLRPELFFTRLNEQFEGADARARLDKIDAPVLFGVYVLKPLSVFAGPSFQYVLDVDIQDIELSRVQEDFTIGLQVGLALDLGNIGFDVRYERGFTENEAQITQVGRLGTLDTRPEQVTAAISVKF